MPTGLCDSACNEPFPASGAHSDPSSSKLQPAGGSGDDASGRGLGGMHPGPLLTGRLSARSRVTLLPNETPPANFAFNSPQMLQYDSR